MTDARITLARLELAPFEFEGVTRARAYGALQVSRSVMVATAMRASNDPEAEQVSQLLYGERFDILRRDGAFAWGQSKRDGYVGWVEARALSTDLVEPLHRIAAPRAAVLSGPAIRAPGLGVIGMNALAAVAETRGAFSRIDGLGWIASCQLVPIGADFREPADVARSFVGTPYVWGGRDGAGGLDCSGLVQQTQFAAGRACPRDADQQAALGIDVDPEDLRTGDLVAWRGHIGMMLDAERLIHANAHHMAVAIEPLATAVVRIAGAGNGEPTAYRRPNPGLPPL